MKTIGCIVLFAALAGCTAELIDDPVAGQTAAIGAGRFEEVTGFGSNPGALKMYRYVPSPEPSAAAPLVVALHACSQSAFDYRRAGWEELADRNGFYVLYPEQTSDNNPIRCFNWAGEYGEPSNLRRGEGENQSIIQMVRRMEMDHRIDAGRIYVTGQSAGAAQAVLMAALWPDVFDGAGVMAAVPYRCGTTVSEAYSCMSGVDRMPADWGRFVREASGSVGAPYPRMSLWHGTRDTIVSPINLREATEQWTTVHGIDATADATEMIGTTTREELHDAAGNTLIEIYRVDAAHGTFVDPDRGCGTAGSYFLDANICAVSRIADFWGILATSTPPGGTEDPPPGGTEDPPPGGTEDPPPGGMEDPPPSSDFPDTTPPVVRILSPIPNQILVGPVPIVIDARDDVAVAEVVVQVDGRDVRTLSAAPFTLRWDTTEVSDGPHTITAIARDAAGNERVEEGPTARVVNEGAPSPGPSGGTDDPTMEPTYASDCQCTTVGADRGARLPGLLLAGLLGVALAIRRRRP